MALLSIVEQVRIFTNDTNISDYWKQDCDIEKALSIAVYMVEAECPLGYTMTGTDESTISPTPTASAKMLFALKTAIVLLSGELSTVARDGIFVKDGDITLDTTKGLEHRRGLLDGLIDQYNTLLTNYKINGDVFIQGHRIDMYTDNTI